jgi:hypothetical protein
MTSTPVTLHIEDVYLASNDADDESRMFAVAAICRESGSLYGPHFVEPCTSDSRDAAVFVLLDRIEGSGFPYVIA